MNNINPEVAAEFAAIYEQNKEIIESVAANNIACSGTIPYVSINFEFPLDAKYTDSLYIQEGKIWTDYDSKNE